MFLADDLDVHGQHGSVHTCCNVCMKRNKSLGIATDWQQDQFPSTELETSANVAVQLPSTTSMYMEFKMKMKEILTGIESHRTAQPCNNNYIGYI